MDSKAENHQYVCMKGSWEIMSKGRFLLGRSENWINELGLYLCCEVSKLPGSLCFYYVTQLGNRFLLSIKYSGQDDTQSILQYTDEGNTYSTFKDLDEIRKMYREILKV